MGSREFEPVVIRDTEKNDISATIIVCEAVIGGLVVWDILQGGSDLFSAMLIYYLIFVSIMIPACVLSMGRARPLDTIKIVIDPSHFRVELKEEKPPTNSFSHSFETETLFDLTWNDITTVRAFTEIYWVGVGDWRINLTPRRGKVVVLTTNSATHVFRLWKYPIHALAARRVIHGFRRASDALGKELRFDRKATWLKMVNSRRIKGYETLPI